MAKMHCFDCKTEREFFKIDQETVCDHCGHCQTSEAQGAADVCLIATWHSLEDYNKTSEIARSGGFSVPKFPNYFIH
jgi:hypothetical protein